MRKNYPNPFVVVSLFIIPATSILVALMVTSIASYNAHATLNWTALWWMVGVSCVVGYILLMRLVWIGETYILKYIRLEKSLREKGLQSWVDEANI